MNWFTDEKFPLTKPLTKEYILQFIEDYDYVSFAELQRRFKETKGNYWWGINDKVWIWMGMSKKFMNIIHKLINTKKIYIKPCSFLVYFMDGALPTFPIIKGNYKYKKEHWLPTIIRPIKKIKEELKAIRETINKNDKRKEK